MFKGRPVSHGIGVGPAVVWQPSASSIELSPLAPNQVEAEVERLQAAVTTTRAEMESLRVETANRLGNEAAAVMEAHQLMLDDPALIEVVIERIRGEQMQAVGLLHQVAEELAQTLSALDDPYLRERAADVRDVAQRLTHHLTGGGGMETVPAGSVLVADDLPPSGLLRLPPGHLAGVALASGGDTSHTAILLRSMRIPAVMGLGAEVLVTAHGTTLLVDGDAGLLLDHPSDDVLAQYREKSEMLERENQALDTLRDLPAETRDGHRLLLAANIGSAQEASMARVFSAEGVGLFRTEFLFLDRAVAPTEAEQYEAYKEALEAMAPHPVVIRTLDVGGDKPLAYLGIQPEENPFLGLRGIRLCQVYEAVFHTQLRALLRAGAYGKLQVMVPMISTLDEVLWVREQVAHVKADLLAESIPCADQLDLGIMIETPAAALMVDQMAPHVDFFSIGTNDLTQYTMAVDRLNPAVASLSDSLHPAVLRLIRMVVEAAHKAGRPVSICGELAGDLAATPLLVGLGLDELSMSAPRLLRVKRAIRSLDHTSAVQLTDRALGLADGKQVRALLKD